ncbi:hypothetical protein ABES02_13605 [Neobacillus pocheonensis]
MYRLDIVIQVKSTIPNDEVFFHAYINVKHNISMAPNHTAI